MSDLPPDEPEPLLREEVQPLEDLASGEELPPKEELTSSNKSVYDRAWAAAYPLLWEWGMRKARRGLAGPEHEANRQDIVQDSIISYQKALMNDTPPDNIVKMF